MDFWNWLWILAFPALLIGGWLIITRMGRTALSRYLSDRNAPEPVALVKTLAEVHKDEQDEWQRTFLELLQKDCTHRYNGNAWKDWYKCLDCEIEQEWVYSGGCSCRTNAFRDIAQATVTYVLMERSRGCTIHGRAIATKGRQDLNNYSEGGYLGLHAPKIGRNPFTHFD